MNSTQRGRGIQGTCICAVRAGATQASPTKQREAASSSSEDRWHLGPRGQECKGFREQAGLGTGALCGAPEEHGVGTRVRGEETCEGTATEESSSWPRRRGGERQGEADPWDLEPSPSCHSVSLSLRPGACVKSAVSSLSWSLTHGLRGMAQVVGTNILAGGPGSEGAGAASDRRDRVTDQGSPLRDCCGCGTREAACQVQVPWERAGEMPQVGRGATQD